MVGGRPPLRAFRAQVGHRVRPEERQPATSVFKRRCSSRLGCLYLQGAARSDRKRRSYFPAIAKIWKAAAGGSNRRRIWLLGSSHTLPDRKLGKRPGLGTPARN